MKKYFTDTIQLYKVIIVTAVIRTVTACFASFYNEITYYAILLGYCDILIFAVTGIMLGQGIYFSKKRYCLYLVFPVWLLITFMLRGEFDITFSVNRAHFLILCISCAVLLPLSEMLGDVERQKILAAVIVFCAAVMCVFLRLAFTALARGENISLLGNRFVFGATYTYTHRMQLQIMNLHYYHTGYYSAVLFFGILYVASVYWKGILKPVWLIMLLTLAAGVFATYSRTAVLSFVAGCLLVIFFTIHKRIKNRTVKILSCTAAAAVALPFTVMVMNRIYAAVNSIRDMWYGIATLSSRTTIWASVIPLIKDHPHILVYGLPLRNAMDTVNIYLQDLDYISHMHSSYLQTLLHLGLPGLAMVAAFLIYLSSCIVTVLKNQPDYSMVFLCIVPVVMIVIGCLESSFIFNHYNMELMNLIFALVCGYIIEYADRLTKN